MSYRRATRRSSSLCSGTACGWALALLLLVCAAPPVQATERDASRIAFRIPSQPLDEALLALAQQAGLQLAAVGDLDRAARSGEVSGVMSVEAALQRLLEDSGYDFELRPGVVTVMKASDRRQAAVPVAVRPFVSPEVVNLAAVVVSARRRDERWIDVPMAVSVMEAEGMETLGLSNVADVVSLMPGVTAVDNGAAFTQVQIRGVSSSLSGNDNGYYLDDVPFTGVTVPWHPDTRSFDLERVEVLKGPQGTLFGEGSMGGTVRIFSRAPELDRTAAEVLVGLSSVEGGQTGGAAKGMLNLPLVHDRLALRVVATRETLPGWIGAADGETAFNEQRIDTQRARLRWSPSDRWITDVGYLRSSTDAAGGGYTADDQLESNARLATRSTWRGTTFSSQYDLSASRVTLLRSDARLRHELDGNLETGSLLGGSIQIEIENSELRWASTGGGPLSWLAGYSHRRSERHDDLRIDGRTAVDVHSNTADAVFGEATLRPAGAAWSVTSGVRYFHEDVRTRGRFEGIEMQDETRFHRISPRLSVSMQPVEQRTVYASVATGFRSGQVQPVESLLRAMQAGISVPSSLAPDTIVSHELGFKQLMSGGRLRMEGAIFHSRWHDLPVRVPIDEDLNALVNSRGARLRGVELDLRYAAVKGLDMSMGGTFTDAQYVADVPDTPLRKGASVYNIPRITLVGSMSYSWAVKGMTASIATNARYHTRRETGLLGQAHSGDTITALDLRLGLQSPRGWGVYLYGDNLSNEQGAVDGRTDLGEATRLRPRTVGLEGHYRF